MIRERLRGLYAFDELDHFASIILDMRMRRVIVAFLVLAPPSLLLAARLRSSRTLSSCRHHAPLLIADPQPFQAGPWASSDKISYPTTTGTLNLTLQTKKISGNLEYQRVLGRLA